MFSLHKPQHHRWLPTKKVRLDPCVLIIFLTLIFCQCLFKSCFTLQFELASTVKFAATPAENILSSNGLSLLKLQILQKTVKLSWRILEYFVRVHVHDFQFFLFTRFCLKYLNWCIVAKSFSLNNKNHFFFSTHIISWSYSILYLSTKFAFADEFNEYKQTDLQRGFCLFLNNYKLNVSCRINFWAKLRIKQFQFIAEFLLVSKRTKIYTINNTGYSFLFSY